ncbi:MucBP domain-containing protein [Ligilactobacillus salivarius]
MLKRGMREVVSRNNLNRKLKYSIRKKKNGGGAASFIVGSVVLGGLMLGGATTVNADEVTQTGTTGTGSQTDTSAKPSGSTDISGTEVALSSPSNGKPAAPESTADATTSAKNKIQPTTSATSESTPEATTTPVITAGDATPESNKDTSATTIDGNNAATAQPTAAEVVKKVSAMSPSQLATNKISISNVRLNKSVVKESEGLDINISFDWTGKGLVKGDSFVTDMTNGFTSITRQVEVPFGANGKQLGVMVLDYDQHKIFTTFTADMDPNKIYNGTINIGTFVDRDYFKNEVNEVNHEIKTADGKTATVPLEVIFDELDINHALGNVSVYGKKTIDNSDGSSDIAWATVINKVKDEMNDATVYISPDKITGVEPKFRLEDNLKTEWDTLGIKYDKNQAYVINPDTIEVYEADVFDSMGYSKGKQLVKGTDYKVDQSELNPHAYVINFIGDYASTNKQFVIEYGGNVPNTHEDRANINATTTDSLVAYYTGKRVKRVYSFDPDYAGPINIVWNAADINFNNSSITGVTSEDITGSVTVVHIDASTGKTLKAEDYVVDSQGQPLHDVEQGTPYTTKSENFEGYRFTTMGYNSDPATGEVKQGLQRVIYLYVPTEVKKGNVDVVYVAEDGKVLEPQSDVAKDAELGTVYSTEQKEFKGYTFSHMGQYSASPTGTVEEGTKHVVYVYAKTGNVDVKYVDTEGKELPGGELTPVKTDEEVGTEYGTTQKTFDGYHFVRMDNASAPAAGVVTAKDQHVIYVYEKDTTPVQPKGNVDVVYVAEDGKVLEPQSDVAKDAELGTVYSTEQKEFKGYTFSHMGQYSASPTGTVEEGTKHVVYVYAKTGNVDVKYVDTEGKELPGGELTPVKTDEEVGTEYGTTQKTFDGYHFVRMDNASAPAAGVVTAKDQHVIYVYEKDTTPVQPKGNVDVVYVAEDGKVLEPQSDVAKDAELGTVYSTEQKEFKGYTFSHMGQYSASPTGTVEEGTKHVIYVYSKNPELKKGSVDVKYIAKDGKVLEDVTKVKDNAPVGEVYTTEEKSFDGYHFVGMDKTSDSANGKVTEGDKHVVYVYEKDVTPEVKKGSVDVKYVTTDGKVLEDVTKVKDNAPVGEVYTTEEKSFDGYHFVGMDKTSDSANGKVTEGDKHVVYVYEKDVTPEVKKGSVDVKYVTTDGKVLEDVTKVKDNAPVGEAYTTEEKSFDGYHFVGMDKTSDSANGKVTEGDKHVVYVYEKNPETPTPEVKKGSVDVKYVTTDGKVLEDVTKVKDNAPVGESYTTEEKSFDGYHFVGMDKTSDSANGKVTEGDKHVVYVYEKDVTPEVKKGSVDVKYVTTDGKVLEDVTKVKDNAPVGEAYTTEEKSFDGYHFVGMDKTSDSANGKVTEGDKHVVYVYEKDVTPEVKKGSVDVKYVTTDGKVLEDVTKVKDNAPVGEAYTTEEKSFDGYHFVGMDKTSDSANGKVTEGDKHVVYVYEKDVTPEVKKGSVDVKYVTTDGKVLEDVTKVKDNAPVGEAYTTEEKSFDGYHFVGMDKTSDSANGKVTEGDKHIVYVYEKDPEVPTTPVEKKGSVYVKYVDENGNELPGGEKTTVVKDGKVGSYYFTTEKDFDGYTFSHMAEGSSDPTGKVVEGDQQVVYVYTKNNTP